MSNEPGFVPVNFALAGKILVGVGGTALLLTLIGELTGWFTLSLFVLILAVVLVLVGLYMIFIVASQENSGR